MFSTYIYSIENCGRRCHVLMEESSNVLRSEEPLDLPASGLAPRQLMDRTVNALFPMRHYLSQTTTVKYAKKVEKF